MNALRMQRPAVLAECPPSTLGESGRLAWSQVWLLGAGWLTGAALPLVEALCRCLDDEARALALVAAGDAEAVLQARIAREQSAVWLSALGFTSVARGRLTEGAV